MAGVLQHLRSSTLNKRPNPASMVDGQVAINYASGAPGMFFKDSNGALVKVGPVHVGSGAPNAVPASGGTAGNSIGEQWLDTSGGTYVFKIWDGSAWRSEAGEFVNVTGDTMTGALGIIAGSATSPSLFISGDANTGLFSPGADQLSVTTGGTERLRVDSAGQIEAVSLGSASAPTYSFTTDPNTGIYSPGADQVAISTNSAKRFEIDANGNVNIDSNTLYVDAVNNRVGVGTTSPSATFHCAGDARIGANDASTAYLEIGAGATGNRFALIDLVGDTTYQDYGLRIVRNNTGANAPSEIMHRGTGALSFNGVDSAPITFVHNATERLRVNSNGSVLIGQTTTETPGVGNTTTGTGLSFGVVLAISRNSGPSLTLNRNTTDGSVTAFYRDGTQVGRIDVTTTGTAYVTSSDYRLKENVTAVTDGITRLQQLKPSRFNFIADPAKTVDGFLAHEAAEIVPECVTGEKDAVDADGNPVYQGIDQSKLVPLLTAALQEAIGEIESLKARVAALESV